MLTKTLNKNPGQRQSTIASAQFVKKLEGVPMHVRSAIPEAMPYTQWKELKEQSILAFESGLLPKSVDTAQKAVTIALMGKELGLSPLQALCGIYVINGMATLKGSLMLRLIYERIPGAEITVLTPPDKSHLECEVEMRRPNGKAHIFRYTLEEAKKAGFMQKTIWQLHTSTMLRWAAIRTGARIIFADAIAGCYMEDEVPSEFEEPKLNEAFRTADSLIAKKKLSDFSQSETGSSLEKPLVSEAFSREERPEPSVSAVPIGEPLRVCDLPLEVKMVTEKQVNRLFGIANGNNWKRSQVAEYLEKWFHKKNPSELNRVEYDKICNYIMASPHSA